MKKVLAVLITLVLSTALNAQKSSELGVFVGGSYYMGDLNPDRHFHLMRLAGGLVYRYNFNKHFAFKANALYGTLLGDDAKANHLIQQKRNLSFRSPALDFSGQIEFNFFPYDIGSLDYPFTMYVFGGVSAFRFNPKAQYGGDWYELQPLGTEGQETISYADRERYHLMQVALPFGLGIKWNIAKGIALNLEWGMRKTFTDYIDDVSTTYPDPALLSAENGPIAAVLSDRSIPGNGEVQNNTGRQRGNSGNKDWYNFTGLMLTIKLGGVNTQCAAYQ